MNDDWRYIGNRDGDYEKIEIGREYIQLFEHVSIIRRAAALLDHYDVPRDTAITHLEEQLAVKMEELAPILDKQIRCNSCWGARCEGHGEACGRCGRRGTISVRLYVGA